MRAVVQDVNPVQYSVLESEDGKSVGYIRVIVFSETTPSGVYSAVQDLAVRALVVAFDCSIVQNGTQLEILNYGKAS